MIEYLPQKLKIFSMWLFTENRFEPAGYLPGMVKAAIYVYVHVGT